MHGLITRAASSLNLCSRARTKSSPGNVWNPRGVFAQHAGQGLFPTMANVETASLELQQSYNSQTAANYIEIKAGIHS